MVLCNKKMEKLLEKIENKKFRIYDATITLKNLILLLQPKFFLIEDCVLIVTKNFKPKKIDINFLVQRYGNKTIYEFGHNEVIVNDYFKYSNKRALDIFWFGLKISEYWENKLKKQFHKDKFTIILSYDGNDTRIRFHKQRTKEGTVLLEDNLDEYENAILLRKF